MSADPILLVHVAKALAFCHYKRGARSPKLNWIEEQANKNWLDFRDDAVFVLNVVNALVQKETFDDAVERMATVPVDSDGVAAHG